MPSKTAKVERTFQDLLDNDLADIEKASSLARHGWLRGISWDELLESQRVLMVSEAGLGKTYECRAKQRELWDRGEAAFFVELSALSQALLADTFGHDEAARFQEWLTNGTAVATFFLDSIDELNLSLGSFELALKRLNRGLAGQLARARVVITTRPIPVDREVIRTQLPVPERGWPPASPAAFADVVMSRRRGSSVRDPAQKPLWRYVRLQPLVQDQMRAIMICEGVTDPDAMLADIVQRDAEEYAQRPQDLIELCALWRTHHRIGTHLEQVQSNVEFKLQPRRGLGERVELSPLRAEEGASRLALAALLCRTLTFRFSADSDRGGSTEAAIDPIAVLTDWSEEERQVLLERPLFGFATYGRVRFHHRSALEYLAARRVDAYLARGVSIRSVKRLLFVDTPQGERVVRPSLRPLAAWLSLWHPAIYEEVRQREPEVLLEFGDPQSLSPARRADLLTAFCDRFGRGGWRGLSFPYIQIRRFGGPELAVPVERLWRAGIENSEVRRLMLQLIEAAKLSPCAWIAHDTLSDEHADEIERIYALDALIALDDARIKEVGAALAADALPWPLDLQRTAALRLFPDRMTIVQFCTLLPRLHEGSSSPDSWGGHLARLLRSIDGGLPGFDQVRHCLTDQLAEGVSWDYNTWPPLKGQRPQLAAALMAVCTSLLRRGLATPEVLRSTAIALRLGGGQFDGEEHAKTLRACLADAGLR